MVMNNNSELPPPPRNVKITLVPVLILNISSLSLLSLFLAEVEKGQKDQKDPGEPMFSLWFSHSAHKHVYAHTDLKPSPLHTHVFCE